MLKNTEIKQRRLQRKDRFVFHMEDRPKFQHAPTFEAIKYRETMGLRFSSSKKNYADLLEELSMKSQGREKKASKGSIEGSKDNYYRKVALQNIKIQEPTYEKYFIKEIPFSKVIPYPFRHVVDWSSSNLLAFSQKHCLFSLWPNDIEEQKLLIFKLKKKGESYDEISSVKFKLIDPNMIGLGATDFSLTLLDIERNKKIMGYQNDETGIINCLDWFDHLLAIGPSSGTVYLKDTRSNGPPAIASKHFRDVTSVKWDISGTKIASGSMDGKINIFCLRMRKNICSSISFEQGFTRNLVWCPFDNSLVAAGNFFCKDHLSEIKFFDTRTCSEKWVIRPEAQVENIIFSPHSRKFVTIHQSPFDEIKIWDYERSEDAMEEFRSQKTVCFSGDLRKNNDSVLSPSGEILATSCLKNIRLWKIFDNKRDKSEGTTVHNSNRMRI